VERFRCEVRLTLWQGWRWSESGAVRVVSRHGYTRGVSSGSVATVAGSVGSVGERLVHPLDELQRGAAEVLADSGLDRVRRSRGIRSPLARRTRDRRWHSPRPRGGRSDAGSVVGPSAGRPPLNATDRTGHRPVRSIAPTGSRPLAGGVEPAWAGRRGRQLQAAACYRSCRPSCYPNDAGTR
jgi:hypothetical protein